MDSYRIEPLTEEMVNLRARGMTWAQIAARTGKAPAECAALVQDYLNSSYSVQTVIEWRMLQVRRLELIMNALWDQVQDGDLLNEGRSTANLIKLIEQITELLDLKKDRLRDEQVRLTQAQTYLIIQTLDAVKINMLTTLLDFLPSAVHQAVESVWHEQFSAIAEQAMADYESTTIKMGPGADDLPSPINPSPGKPAAIAAVPVAEDSAAKDSGAED